jgi:DNA-binding protein
LGVQIELAGNLILLEFCTNRRDDDPIGSMAMIIHQGNMVRIGKKPLISYVVACVTLFNSGKREIMVRARGRAIPKAIDTVGMLKRSFLKELMVKSVDIGSEDITRYDGRGTSVSTIEITLTRKEEAMQKATPI